VIPGRFTARVKILKPSRKSDS